MSETTDATPLGSLLAALADSPETAAMFDSWTVDGANDPITAQNIIDVMNAQDLSALAAQAGVSEEEAAEDLAEQIPPLVDAIPSATIQSVQAAQPSEQASILQKAGITSLAQVNKQPKNILPLLQQLG